MSTSPYTKLKAVLVTFDPHPYMPTAHQQLNQLYEGNLPSFKVMFDNPTQLTKLNDQAAHKLRTEITD